MKKHLKNSRGTDYYYYENSLIGNGTTSEVFLGTNKQTQEQVVIKCIYKPRFEDMNLRAEILALRDLERKSSNILQMLDFFQTNNHIYIILEYCEGENLRSLLSKNQGHGLNSAQAIQYLYQIVQGLMIIHSQGYIYRDLKPDNILFKEGQLKIADFGLAVKASSSNEYVGTREYLAPELNNLIGDKTYNKQVDVWSLGIIFHEMLFGEIPGDGDYKVMRELFCRDYKVSNGRKVQVEAKDLLEKMMKINPSERITIEEINQHPFFDDIRK